MAVVLPLGASRTAGRKREEEASGERTALFRPKVRTGRPCRRCFGTFQTPLTALPVQRTGQLPVRSFTRTILFLIRLSFVGGFDTLSANESPDMTCLRAFVVYARGEAPACWPPDL